MNLQPIETKLLNFCSYIQNVKLSFLKKNQLKAVITLNIDKFKKNQILNIYNEILWNCIEAFHLHEEKEFRIISFTLQSHQKYHYKEPTSQTYTYLKKFLLTLTKQEISFNSHLELDLALDSLDFLLLLTFLDEQFHIKLTEAQLSQYMYLFELYNLIENKTSIHTQTPYPSLQNILQQPFKKQLIYSPKTMIYYKMMLLPLFKIYFRFTIKGKKNIPQTPTIFAPMHQSFLDGFLLLASLPLDTLKKTFFLSFRGVSQSPLYEKIALHGQNILIDQNKDLATSLKYASLAIQEHNNLVIFPEGARSRDAKLLPFKPFFAILAKTFNLPVVPIVIKGSFSALKTGDTIIKPKKIELHYLPKIDTSQLSVDEIIEATKIAIQTNLK